jgi:hypothetical protein
VLWGIDPMTGEFKENEHKVVLPSSIKKKHTKQWLWWSQFTNVFTKRKTQTVQHLLLLELEKLYEELASENEKFQWNPSYQSEREKAKRLLFLLQKDLMPGISGQILDSKDQRDDVIVKGVAQSVKVSAWIYLAVLNVSMLFYVFLFALSQDSYRQRAWAKSFCLWLVMEILMVSSFTVCFMHVFLPSITMKDVNKIRIKLVDSIIQYEKVMNEQDRLNNQDKQREECLEIDHQFHFNAAKYLFLSYRLAVLYPNIKVSPIIRQFSTPWPRQSYQHVTDMSKEYDRTFDALSKSISMVAMFFLSNLLTVPLAMQDMIIQMCSTTLTGYAILLHIHLYKIYPVLIAIPALFLAVLIHFFVQSNKAQSKIALAQIIQGADSRNHAEEEKKRRRRVNRTPQFPKEQLLRRPLSTTEIPVPVATNIAPQQENQERDDIEEDWMELSSDSDTMRNEQLHEPYLTKRETTHAEPSPPFSSIHVAGQSDNATGASFVTAIDQIIKKATERHIMSIEQKAFSSMQDDKTCVEECNSNHSHSSYSFNLSSDSSSEESMIVHPPPQHQAVKASSPATTIHTLRDIASTGNFHHHVTRRQSVQQGIELLQRVANHYYVDRFTALNSPLSESHAVEDDSDEDESNDASNISIDDDDDQDDTDEYDDGDDDDSLMDV